MYFTPAWMFGSISDVLAPQGLTRIPETLAHAA